MSEPFDLVVGHSHHIKEATTNVADALQIIHGREGTLESFNQSPYQRIDEVYQKDTYAHYGNAGEPPMPLCKVDDQDAVDVDGPEHGLLNVDEPNYPVSCTTDQDITFYVTAWAR